MVAVVWLRRRLFGAFCDIAYTRENAGWLGSRVVIACWTQAQKGPGSNRSRDAVG